MSSPLARVAEEAPSAIKVHTEVDEDSIEEQEENLIQTESTAEPTLESEHILQGHTLLNGHDDKENRGFNGDIGLGVKNIDLNDSHEAVGEMKEVDI